MVQTKEEVLIRKRERAKNRKTEGICKDCGLAAEPNSDGTYKCRCWRCAQKHNQSNHGQHCKASKSTRIIVANSP